MVNIQLANTVASPHFY